MGTTYKFCAKEWSNKMTPIYYIWTAEKMIPDETDFNSEKYVSEFAYNTIIRRLEEKIESLQKIIENKDLEIEDLEWENKGIAEWRDVALKSMESCKELRKELERLHTAHNDYNMPVGRDHDKIVNVLYDIWPYISIGNIPQHLLDRINQILDIEDERRNSDLC